MHTCRTRRSTSPTETFRSTSEPRSLPGTTCPLPSRPRFDAMSTSRTEGRGLRRGQGPGRDRQGPPRPVHRALPGGVEQHDPRAASSGSASGAGVPASTSSTSSAAPTSPWSTRTASRPAGAAISASATSATAAAQPSEPRGRRVARRASSAPPAAALRHGRRAPGQPEVEDLDSDPRPLSGRGGGR